MNLALLQDSVSLHDHEPAVSLVTPDSPEASLIREEEQLLATVLMKLAEQGFERVQRAEYDRDLISLRDQISEARLEDVSPLVAEMYRLAALGARSGTVAALPVDVKSPYFGHLRLVDERKTREILIGSRGFAPTGEGFAIVDWRNAPVSRIYYRYEEGDDYEEAFGGRISHGTVAVRRAITIADGALKRITWSEGAVARRKDGAWVRLTGEARPRLHGGAGIAARPAPLHEKIKRGRLGVVGDESLRDDKRLQAVTALIDKAQFDAITKPESGIVILQGGAGSGKTTVALHRAAYLHFQSPNVFASKKMLIVVRSPALVEYIARVLPSLGVPGVKVESLEAFMTETRRKVLPSLRRPRIDDVPAAVSKLKKHPAVLWLIERSAEREADEIGAELLSECGDGPAQRAVEARWKALGGLPILPRLRQMAAWVEGAVAERGGVTAKLRGAMAGTLRRARAPLTDVLSTWATVLTDAEALRSAFDVRSPGQVSDAEIHELVKWVSAQAEELEIEEDDEDEEEERDRRVEKRRRARQEAQELVGLSRDAEEEEEEDDDPTIGVDGRHVDDGSPTGKLDPHDDALLLRLVQLRVGSLPISGSQKTVAYEHVVVDEAQDLSPTDIAVLRGVLTKRQSMTLAGDTAQKLVFDNGFEDWKALLRDLGIDGVELEPLRVSYRSPREIMRFARAVLGPLADPVEPIAPRSGAPVETFGFSSTGEAVAFLAEALRGLVVREKRASVAVIARYAAQASIYYDALRNAEVPALRRVYGKDFSFEPGIDVVDVAQIKGLEYDYVVLVEVNASTYPDAIEARHLLHIASTRAVHQLWVTSVGAPSPLLPGSA
ncbi:MAG: ATP-binding domain-containing protein [Deltaproteobacteria bacterium]|nr:ATP-binding domain-containing protein [Deltaproteobacteria bacterium]